MKKVVGQEVHWVPGDRKVELSRTERPFRVWTLYSLGDLPESKDRPPDAHNARPQPGLFP